MGAEIKEQAHIFVVCVFLAGVYTIIGFALISRFLHQGFGIFSSSQLLRLVKIVSLRFFLSLQWQQLIIRHLSLQFICTCIAINVYNVQQCRLCSAFILRSLILAQLLMDFLNLYSFWDTLYIPLKNSCHQFKTLKNS